MVKQKFCLSGRTLFKFVLYVWLTETHNSEKVYLCIIYTFQNKRKSALNRFTLKILKGNKHLYRKNISFS